MLNLTDKRWEGLHGGYRQEFDPRPMLAELEANKDAKRAWHELWENLHHQGDVGVASYAAVPHLVRIYRSRKNKELDWNTYAIAAVVELARDEADNPPLPVWLKQDYSQALKDLATVGASEILSAKAPEEARAILAILAIFADARTHARFLVNYSAEELVEMQKLAEG